MIPASSGWLLTLTNYFFFSLNILGGCAKEEIKGGGCDNSWHSTKTRGQTFKIHKEEETEMLKLTIRSPENSTKGYLFIEC